MIASSSYKPDTGASTTWTNSYTLGATGAVKAVDIDDGRPRDVTFKTDVTGQAIRRDEADTNTSAGDPHSVWYRFNGREMGRITNDGTVYTDYASSIGDRQTQSGSGAFQFGAASGRSSAEFGIAYEAINSFSQGSAGGGYVVQAGDTLAGIAQRLYGDANLWYKIAEANGLSSAAVLVEGRTLTLPPGVSRNANTAATFKPYDPAEALGDVSPTTPKPSKKAKCGMFGQILTAVISLAATVFLTPIIGPVGAAVAGNVASQGFGLATGMQDKFNFKSVAMTAITAGLTAGVGELGALAEAGKITGGLAKAASFLSGSGLASTVVRSMAVNGIAQGIGVATGLQSKFDFAGVATAGVGAGIGHVVGGALGARSLVEDGSARNVGANIAVGAASLFANAATRSAINGNSFGDNIMAALPDAIGQIIGGALGGAALREREAAAASSQSGSESASPAGSRSTTAGQDAEIIVTARSFQPGLAIDYFWGLLAARNQVRSAAYAAVASELVASGGGVTNAPALRGKLPTVKGSGFLPGGDIAMGQRWADYLVLTDRSIDIDNLLENNAAIYGGMRGKALGRDIFLSGNDGQVRRQILPMLETLASDSNNGGRFDAAFYKEAVNEISALLAAVDARAAPGLAQIDREGLAALSLMATPLIAMSGGAGGMLGWTGAGLQTNRTAQSLISAGVERDTVSPLGQILPYGDRAVAGIEIVTGGYGLLKGGVGAYSAWRAGAAAESTVVDLGLSSSRYSLSAPRVAGFEGTQGTLRRFTSNDPLVANLANDIEALYPGHVVGVNVPIRNATGGLVTDADILLRNSILQVKSGGGKGLTSQILRTEGATGIPTIGYGPTLKPSVVRSINQTGGLVTTDRGLLLEVVKP